MIDLRSDTVTRPTPEMRQAMATARVGDDVIGDDPTVNELEARTAALLGKQAAVYMPSGTMTNQVGLKVHTQPGDELLLHTDAHIYYYEAGAPAALSGLTCRLLPGPRGIFTADAIRNVVRPDNIHFAPARLLAIENTHNRGGGSVWPIDQLRDVCAAAREFNLATHLDGARIWNAAAASGVSERDIAAPFDTVSVCFSKGLGAPIGSALAGDRATMDRARRFRKMLGGGMRQAGIIAAGALHALDNHRERLADDHANATRFAHGISDIKGIELDVDHVETNIVMFECPGIDAAELVRALGEQGVFLYQTGSYKCRAVTHLDVNEQQIDQAVRIVENVIENVK